MSCDSGKHFSRLSRSDCSDSYAAYTLTFRGMRREKEESRATEEGEQCGHM